MASLSPWIARIARSLMIAALPVLNLAGFATFAIYAGNTSEFGASYPALIAVILPYAAMLVIALAVPGFFLNDRGRSRYETLLCAFAILLWIQGSILLWNYGVFDGSSINWLEGAWRGILDTVLWIVVLLLAIYQFERLCRGFLYAAIATVLIQSVTVVTELSGDSQILQARDSGSNIDGRTAAMRFSSTNNIVHIVMDGFQSDVFAAIVADSSERDFKRELRGFTYFTKNVGAYPYTQLTLPAMLSGQMFANEVPVDDFVDAVMQGPTIINSAADAGYEVDIAAPIALKNVYAKGSHTNAFGIATNNHVTEQDITVIHAAKLVDLALFRTLPHFGKALVHRDELWVFQAKVQSSTYLHLQYFADLDFLRDMTAEMTADRATPVYKIIHVMLSHRPIVGNERCEFDGRKRETRESVTTHAQCGFVEVLNVLHRMKDLGIYDSSLIVLMADHGAWTPIENFEPTTEFGALEVAMATPTLAIKPPNAKHAFKESLSPTAITDVPATIADLAGIDIDLGGQSAFEIAEDAQRRRRHITYGYGRNPAAEGYLFPMQEWIVDGDPYLAESWSKGERYLPAK